MIYRNAGPTTKVFHGVEFKPGDIKEVRGRIYHHNFVVMNSIPNKHNKYNNSGNSQPAANPDIINNQKNTNTPLVDVKSKNGPGKKPNAKPSPPPVVEPEKPKSESELSGETLAPDELGREKE